VFKTANVRAACKVAILSVAFYVSIPALATPAHGPHFGGFGNCGNIGWSGNWGGGLNSGWGGYGMGGGFRHSGYSYPTFGCSNFGYSGIGFGFPSYSYSNYYSGFGDYGCASSYYQPVAIRPVVYYRPIQYCPTPIIHRPIIYKPAVPLCTVPLCTVPLYAVPLGDAPLSAATIETTATKVAYTASSSWTKEAIDLIDAMAHQGGSAEGYAAGKQLLKTHKALPGHFYTRMAVLSALNNSDSSEVLNYLTLAKKHQADPNGRDLPGGSLRMYVATLPNSSKDNSSTAKLSAANASMANASIDSLLNQIAEKALSKPKDRKPEFQVLAALLVIDGQADRASRFMNAIQSPDSVPVVAKIDTQRLALAK